MTINSSSWNEGTPVVPMDLKKIFQALYSKKLWIIASFGLFLFLGVLYSLTRPSVYQSEALFMVEEEKGHATEQMAQMMTGFELGGASSSFDNQMALIKSYDLISRVVENLDLDLVIDKQGLLKSSYCYKEYPFKITFDSSIAQPLGHFASLTKVSLNQWQLDIHKGDYSTTTIVSDKTPKRHLISEQHLFTEDVTIHQSSVAFSLKLLSGKEKEVPVGTTYSIQLRSTDDWVKYFLSHLTVAPISKKTSIVKLQCKTSVPALGVDFLNQLMAQLRKEELVFRNRKADGVIEFIDNQLVHLSDSLRRTEKRISLFQQQHAVVGLDKQAVVLYDKIQDIESTRMKEQLCLRYGAYLNRYLKEHIEGTALSPSMMGVDDLLMQKEVEKLNKIQTAYAIEKGKILTNPSELMRLDTLKSALYFKLSNLIGEWEQQHQQRLSQHNTERTKLLTHLRSLPDMERRFQELQRHYKVQASIYDYLLMQRTTSQIAKASNRAKGSVVEASRLDSTVKVAPKKPLLILVFAFLGLALPIGTIILFYFLGDKICDIHSLQSEVENQEIITVGHSRCGPKPVIFDPLSVVSEQFYQIRTILDGRRTNFGRGEIYLVSSAYAGEGKTFASVNLALTYAKRGVKVLLIGADLRKPRLQNLLDHSSENGLIDYLEGAVEVEDIVPQGSEEGLDLLLSGRLGKDNPADLLSSLRMRALLKYYRQHYDIILLDSAPLGMVPDTLSLLGVCDRMLFVVRRGVTQKRNFSSVWEYIKEHNPALLVDFILNDVPGPTYYHRDQETRIGFYQKIKKRIKHQIYSS